MQSDSLDLQQMPQFADHAGDIAQREAPLLREVVAALFPGLTEQQKPLPATEQLSPILLQSQQWQDIRKQAAELSLMIQRTLQDLFPSEPATDADLTPAGFGLCVFENEQQCHDGGQLCHDGPASALAYGSPVAPDDPPVALDEPHCLHEVGVTDTMHHGGQWRHEGPPYWLAYGPANGPAYGEDYGPASGEKIETSTWASGPTAALNDPSLGPEQQTNNEQGGPQYVWPPIVPICHSQYCQYGYPPIMNPTMMTCWSDVATFVDPATPHGGAVGTGSTLAEVLNSWLLKNTSLIRIADDRPERHGKLCKTWTKIVNAPAEIPLPTEMFDVMLPNATTLAAPGSCGEWDITPRLGSQVMQKLLAISTPSQKKQIIMQLASSAQMLLYHDSGCFVVSQLLEEGRCF